MSRIVNHQLREFDELQLTINVADTPGSNKPVFTIIVTEGVEDQVPVIMIDTPEDGGRFRIAVNDGCIWDADPNAHHHAHCECTGEGELAMSRTPLTSNTPLTKLINITVVRQQQTEVRVPLDFPVGDEVSETLLDLIAVNEDDDTSTLSITSEVVMQPEFVEVEWTATRQVKAKLLLAGLPADVQKVVNAGHRINAADIEFQLRAAELAMTPGEIFRVITAQTILEG